MSNERIERAARLLLQAKSVTVLTGAGVSAESGVATFRDAQTGLWARYEPEKLASPEGWASDPGLVWRWYMSRFAGVASVQPNPGHYALAAIERAVVAREGSRFLLLTQNIDPLHEAAGSRRVRHLHGNIASYKCSRCSRPHVLKSSDRTREQPPRCPDCDAFIRPDVVWFGEDLPRDVLDLAWDACHTCDVMLVAGTSGQVYPAAQFPMLARQVGAAVIDVNPDSTPISEIAEVFLQGPSGEMLPRIVAAMGIGDGESAGAGDGGSGVGGI